MTEEQVRIVLTLAAAAAAGAVAALLWGGVAVDLVLAACVGWLLWDRAELLERCDRATDAADRALAHRMAEAEAAPDPVLDAYREQLDRQLTEWRAGVAK